MGIMKGYYQELRDLIPDRFKKWISGYDFPGEEAQDLQQRRQGVIYSEVIDLSTARDPSNPYKIAQSGVAISIIGINTDNVYDPITNTGTEAAEPSVFMVARVNDDRPENAAHLKHNRGFIGTFGNVYLSWPAQPNCSARILIHKYDARPWINGESDNRFGAVQGTSISVPSNVVLVANTSALVAAEDLKRKQLTIYNSSTTDTVWLGGNPAVVGSGIPIPPEGYAYWQNTSAIYAISSGTPTLSMVLER